MQRQFTIPTAEPFLFTNGPVGCLLVHGFTGTPKEMRPLGEFLAHKGYTSMGVRLAGHATQPDDMLRTHWQDWLASVEDGIHYLRCCTDKVFVMGLSMGGVLTLLAAARYEIAGAVALSTPFALAPDPRLKWIPLLAHIQPEVEKGPPDWRDPSNLTEHKSYPAYPTLGIGQLNSLLAEMRSAIPDIRVPVLLMQSRTDTSILPESMERIYALLTTQEKHMVWVENSGHVITREPEKEKVFTEIDAFLRPLS